MCDDPGQTSGSLQEGASAIGRGAVADLGADSGAEELVHRAVDTRVQGAHHEGQELAGDR
jgi:hypothetical protein